MFDREIKLSQLMQEKTASQFGDNSDDSVVYEVEAEREYVGRLKVQREKVCPCPCRSRDSTPNMTYSSRTSNLGMCSSRKKTVSPALPRNHQLTGVEVPEPVLQLPGILSLQTTEPRHQVRKHQPTEGHFRAGGLLHLPAWPV